MSGNNDTHVNTITFEGELYVQGWFSSWKLRYCTLCTSRTLNFYNNKNYQINTKPLNTIDLSTVITINQITNLPHIQLQSSSNPSPHSISPQSQSTISQSISISPPSVSISQNALQLQTFSLITSSDKYIIGSYNIDIINLWIKYLNQFIFGDIIHSGYMTKQGKNIKSWKNRWFTLSSNWGELRYYIDNEKDNDVDNYRGKINLYSVNILRSGDKNQYGYQYTIELITKPRIYILVNMYYNEHTKWMNNIENVLNATQNQCKICSKSRVSDNDNVYYKMDVVYEGELNLYSSHKWIKNYYAIDGRTIRLFYTNTLQKMVQFQNSVIKKDIYEYYCEKQLNGYYLLCGEDIQILEYKEKKKKNNLKILQHNNNNYMSTNDGMIVGEYASGCDGSSDDNDNDNDNNIDIVEIDPFIKVFRKFKYKFYIGEDIFGVSSFSELKKWINALNKVCDFTIRDNTKYYDERYCLCKNHINIFVCGYIHFLLNNNINIISKQILSSMIMFIGNECADDKNIVIF